MSKNIKQRAIVTSVSGSEVAIEVQNIIKEIRKGDNLVITKSIETAPKRGGMIRRLYGKPRVVETITRGEVTDVQADIVRIRLQSSRTNMKELSKLVAENKHADIYIVEKENFDKKEF